MLYPLSYERVSGGVLPTGAIVAAGGDSSNNKKAAMIFWRLVRVLNRFERVRDQALVMVRPPIGRCDWPWAL